MQDWKEAFHFFCEDRNRQYLSDQLAQSLVYMTSRAHTPDVERWQRVEEDWKLRKINIRASNSHIHIFDVQAESPYVHIDYELTTRWQLEQLGQEYEQAWMEPRHCMLKEDGGWMVVEDRLQQTEGGQLMGDMPLVGDEAENVHSLENRLRGRYDRAKAVEYAHRWWNDYNPKFKKFDVDCTNYISQCLWAGNAPMKYSEQREKGWWYRFQSPPNWSFSWAVAHSLRWYLPSSGSGLRGEEVSSASELQPGDVIVYDFDGDGTWQHNTIVVAKDGQGEPLVNAHTTNSQNRFWAYRDSHAWTENTMYKFFRIVDQF